MNFSGIEWGADRVPFRLFRPRTALALIIAQQTLRSRRWTRTPAHGSISAVRRTNRRSMRRVDRLFESYGRYHQDPVNKAIHWICVPLIVWSVLGMLWAASPLAACAAIAAMILFYLFLSVPLAFGMLAVVAAMTYGVVFRSADFSARCHFSTTRRRRAACRQREAQNHRRHRNRADRR